MVSRGGGGGGSLLPEELEEVPVVAKLGDDAEGLALGADGQDPGHVRATAQGRGSAVNAGQEGVAENRAIFYFILSWMTSLV